MREQVGTLAIEKRFCGPPDSGNGGYVCGRLAGFVEGPARVTLRHPPPLGASLVVFREQTGKVLLKDGERLIAEAVSIPGVELTIPEPPSFEEAKEASRHYVGFSHHVFPTCFVCGPERKEGDGLCLFPGLVSGRSLVASPFVPDHSLADEKGLVAPTFLWAALDCPGAFAVGLGEERFVVLGRLAVEPCRELRVGTPCVVVGWPLGEEGRKLYAGTAVFDEDGALIAKGEATWVIIDPATFGGQKKAL